MRKRGIPLAVALHDTVKPIAMLFCVRPVPYISFEPRPWLVDSYFGYSFDGLLGVLFWGILTLGNRCLAFLSLPPAKLLQAVSGFGRSVGKIIVYSTGKGPKKQARGEHIG